MEKGPWHYISGLDAITGVIAESVPKRTLRAGMIPALGFRGRALSVLVSCPRNTRYFVAIKMGRRQGARGEHISTGYVTDEQRGRRPIFIATLRAVASWLFFRVARSLHIDSDMLVVRALKNSQLIRQLPDESHVIYGTAH